MQVPPLVDNKALLKRVQMTLDKLEADEESQSSQYSKLTNSEEEKYLLTSVKEFDAVDTYQMEIDIKAFHK